MNNKTLLIAGVVLAAGAAVGGYRVFGPTYADVVSADPIVVKEPILAEVLAATPVRETVAGTREVCEDREVERRAPERFGDKDGMVVGAVVGGLVGNQVGKGRGRDLATVAGAVAGGYAGREIDRRHEGGRRYTETVRDCRVVEDNRERVVGYDVQYAIGGEVKTLRMDKKPGSTVQLGEREVIVGYDVRWTYQGQSGTVRMSEKPGSRLPIKDGVIVQAQASAPAGPTG
ncbi:MAG: membrane protein [Silanimonas sp.]|nr:MAG: membrane protein [Silanimonas sp.]